MAIDVAALTGAKLKNPYASQQKKKDVPSVREEKKQTTKASPSAPPPDAGMPANQKVTLAWWDKADDSKDMAIQDQARKWNSEKQKRKKRSDKASKPHAPSQTKAKHNKTKKKKPAAKPKPAFQALSVLDNKALERKNDKQLEEMNRAHQKRTTKYKTDPYHRQRYLRAKQRLAQTKNYQLTRKEKREAHALRKREVEKCYAIRAEALNPNKWVDIDLETALRMHRERMRKEQSDIAQQHYELYHGAEGNPKRRIQVLKHKLLRRKITPQEQQELENLSEFVRMVEFSKFSLDQSHPPPTFAPSKMVKMLHLAENGKQSLLNASMRKPTEEEMTGTQHMLAYHYLHSDSSEDEDSSYSPFPTPRKHKTTAKTVPQASRGVQADTDPRTSQEMRQMMHVLLEQEISKQMEKDVQALVHQKWHLEFQAQATEARVAALEQAKRNREQEEELFARQCFAKAEQLANTCAHAIEEVRQDAMDARDQTEFELRSTTFDEEKYRAEMERKSELMRAMDTILGYEIVRQEVEQRLASNAYEDAAGLLEGDAGVKPEDLYFGLDSERDVVKGTIHGVELISPSDSQGLWFAP